MAAPGIPAKTTARPALAADFLKKIKTLLLEQELKLERELAQFAKKNPRLSDDFNSNFPDYGDKEDENAAEVAEYAVNLSLEQDLERMLRDVKLSLERLAEGTYGICRYCGKPIDAKRLLIRPTSSACVACKKAITQEV